MTPIMFPLWNGLIEQAFNQTIRKEQVLGEYERLIKIKVKYWIIEKNYIKLKFWNIKVIKYYSYKRLQKLQFFFEGIIKSSDTDV